jgi:hypothetical protein
MLTLSVTIDQKALDRYLKKLDKNRGKPLRTRAENTTFAAAQKLLVPAIQKAAPRKRGTLRHRVKAKRLPMRAGEDMRPVYAGAYAPHAHLVVGGTAAHSLETVRSGKSDYAVIGLASVSRGGRGLEKVGIRRTVDLHHPGAKANPFVERATDPIMDDVYRLIARDVFDVT